jgi:hypothetical protein
MVFSPEVQYRIFQRHWLAKQCFEPDSPCRALQLNLNWFFHMSVPYAPGTSSAALTHHRQEADVGDVDGVAP